MMNKEKISDECAANNSLKQPASQSVQGKQHLFKRKSRKLKL